MILNKVKVIQSGIKMKRVVVGITMPSSKEIIARTQATVQVFGFLGFFWGVGWGRGEGLGVGGHA